MNYTSLYSIGEEVSFIPMYRHQRKLGIEEITLNGTITAIRFTESKVFYDILDNYYAHLFDNVDSIKVGKETIEYLK